MKSLHLTFGIVAAVVIGYALGIYFPAIGNSIKAKLP